MSDGRRAETRLYLVRHGLVHNPTRLAYGHLPRFRIAAEGQEQARRTGAWLAERGIAAIYVSPLLRARQTAQIIRAAVGDVPVHTSRRLRESELARFWQGLPWQEIATMHPELYAMFESTPSQVTAGETMTTMARRVRSVCLQAARRYAGGAVVLVSHRDPIVTTRLAAEGASLDALNQTPCTPGSITEMCADGRTLRFVQYVEP